MRENRGINITALALGALTDIGGSLVAGSAIGIIVVIVLAAQGVPQNELAARLEGPMILVPGLILGFPITLLGGFVAGRVSKHSEVLHGGLVGLIGLLFGLLFSGSLPLWYSIVSAVGVVPFGMAGGRLAAGNRQRIAKDFIAEPPSSPSDLNKNNADGPDVG